MTKTSTLISFGLFALEIAADSIPSTATTLQPFSKVDDLRNGNASYLPLATFEPDFWLLDGGYKLLPADTSRLHVGMMSLAQSSALGVFASPPVLTINFQSVHSTDGLTLHFSAYTGDWPNDITVAYYNSTDALIRSDNYAPDAAEWSTGQAVADFKKIVITFRGTNKPTRYLRLAGIDYGQLYWFEDENIQAANVVEECDPLALELRVGSFETRLYSADAMFSILNPLGQYESLAQGQPISVYEVVDNQQLFLGRYYLDEWENQGEFIITFRCYDLLGKLDRMTFSGGMFVAEAAGSLFDEMLGGIGVPYEVDPALAAVALSGWLPVSSYRDALQLAAYAAGAMVICARSGAVRILPARIAAVETPVDTIGRMDQGVGGSITLKPLVTGVEVNAHQFQELSTTVELFNDTLAVGSHEIIFPDPYHTLAASGAAIASSGVNYAILTVTVEGPVVLTGRPYRHIAKTYSVTGTFTGLPNVVKIEECTMLGYGGAQATAQRLYDYLEQRYRLKMRLYAPLIEVGDVVIADTLYAKQIQGLVERMDIDLARGMIASVEVVGVEVV